VNLFNLTTLVSQNCYHSIMPLIFLTSVQSVLKLLNLAVTRYRPLNSTVAQLKTVCFREIRKRKCAYKCALILIFRVALRVPNLCLIFSSCLVDICLVFFCLTTPSSRFKQIYRLCFQLFPTVQIITHKPQFSLVT
jgi:hypothetical protein